MPGRVAPRHSTVREVAPFRRSAKRWVSHHKVDIALTAVSFVPGLGQAAWAYRAYRGYRAYRAYRAVRTARYASRSCRVNSFTPDTRVLMADGTSRDIDDIAIGDLVLAADPDTGQTSAEPVTDLIIGSGEKDLVTITADPDRDGHSGSVAATAGHPFHTTTGWHDADDLTPAHRLTTDTRTLRRRFGGPPTPTARHRLQFDCRQSAHVLCAS